MPGALSVAASAELGVEIPHGEPHALSVSLPTWLSNVAWASGDEDTIRLMTTGYPRFFVHRKIQQLADIILQHFNIAGKLSHLFPTAHAAEACVAYLKRHAEPAFVNEFDIKAAHIPLDDNSRSLAGRAALDVFCVTFPAELKKLGKSFWQHTGAGVSSRYAECSLANISNPGVRYYTYQPGNETQNEAEDLHPDTQRITTILSKRIASLALTGKSPEDPSHSGLHTPQPALEGHGEKSEPDVYLYPSGMSAIWHAHQLIMELKPGLKSVCFGFPYTDTVKILEKWGPGCIFYGDHPDKNLAEFEKFLESTPCPIAALFCECPSNPLLQSPNLPRLRELADQYNFLIVIDDTIGTFVNVDVLQYVDIVTTSLSKLYSGKANVLGGSMTINTGYKFYHALTSLLAKSHSNDYFLPDLMCMEENSRDFEYRVHKVDANTRTICHFLRSHSRSYRNDDSSEKFVIKDVFYPEWITRENYDLSRRPGREDNFGHLFSLTFVGLEASAAFYNTLQCAKGPSLGTNFTLACPYTLLAHWWERPWAAEFGVEEGIVRISVGMEEPEVLMRWFEAAVKAAEATLP